MAQQTMSSGRITIIRGAGGIPVAVSALRERRAPSSPDDQLDAPRETNPFAPPAKGTPDRPWRPRRHAAHDDQGSGDSGDSGGQGGPDGPGGSGGPRDDGRDPGPSNGDRWSSDQPAPHHGDGSEEGPFGSRPGGTPPGRGSGPGGPGGQQPPGGPGRQPQEAGPRFDVTDPAHRRARYALLSGMWGLFFGLFGLPEVALLLGALGLYWGISSLRGKVAERSAAERKAPSRAGALSAWQPSSGTAARPTADSAAGGPGSAPDPAAQGSGQHKPQFTAALCGAIAAGLALTIVAVTFSFQIVYKDYFNCVSDALTQPARQSCETLLPVPLRHVLSNQG